MNTYAWACLACEQTNAAGALTCARCNCPARATSVQVDSTRANWRRQAGLPAVVAPDPIAVIKTLPLLPIAAVLLLALGALMLIVDMGASASAFGGLLIALAALCASSWRKPAPAAGSDRVG